MIIIDYGLGNLASIHNMLKQIGSEPVISDDYDLILNSKELILPGVGNFEKGIQNLRAKSLDKAIIKACKNKARLLGICLGMHLLFDKSEEGKSSGLGLVEGQVKKFRFTNNEFKVPHMGWNNVKFSEQSKLNFVYKEKHKFYFAHSFYVECVNTENEVGTTNYGFKFTSSIEKKNIYGVQFHPEKSHNFGKNFLRNFYKY
jgi:glutamine amidotransferase